MGLVDSCQPNQQTNVTAKYDKHSAIATISRNYDAIAAIYMSSLPSNCEPRHINAIKSEYSYRITNTRKVRQLQSRTFPVKLIENRSNLNASPSTSTKNSRRVTVESTPVQMSM